MNHLGIYGGCSVRVRDQTENLKMADDVINDMLSRIQPTVMCQKKRQDVIQYVQALIWTSLGFEVFPYGSVPLKTYLYDGDIDLTILCSPAVEATLFSDVYKALKTEERNKAAPFEVKEVLFIAAEVRLVKCIVGNIVVDISFNQLGGLRTLCFLEKVDRLIGKNHLYKRSVILIKAWCWYESRVLGAHHGLISTYALETLVLYIVLLFDPSRSSPVSVLHRFLEYYSNFDWEKYCISLNGPVCRSSLLDIMADLPENSWDKQLRHPEFLHKYVKMFSTPSRGLETTSRAFPQKHMNIIDPLNKSNNLGRSVSKGNFYRICSAFKYGAHKLGQILSLPSEQVTAQVNIFFKGTIERNRSSRWITEQNIASTLAARCSYQSFSTPHPNMCLVDGEESSVSLNLVGDFDRHYWSVLHGEYLHLCAAASQPLPPNASEEHRQHYFPNTSMPWLGEGSFQGSVPHNKIRLRACESNEQRNDKLKNDADFPPLSTPGTVEMNQLERADKQ